MVPPRLHSVHPRPSAEEAPFLSTGIAPPGLGSQTLLSLPSPHLQRCCLYLYCFLPHIFHKWEYAPFSISNCFLQLFLFSLPFHSKLWSREVYTHRLHSSLASLDRSFLAAVFSLMLHTQGRHHARWDFLFVNVFKFQGWVPGWNPPPQKPPSHTQRGQEGELISFCNHHLTSLS
jgi:hypothetical protein